MKADIDQPRLSGPNYLMQCDEDRCSTGQRMRVDDQIGATEHAADNLRVNAETDRRRRNQRGLDHPIGALQADVPDKAIITNNLINIFRLLRSAQPQSRHINSTKIAECSLGVVLL